MSLLALYNMPAVRFTFLLGAWTAFLASRWTGAVQYEGHWEADWDFGPGVTITLPWDENPDPRAEFKGSHQTSRIVIGDGDMHMYGKPRYYIDNTDIGWRNTEFTGYVTWMQDGEIDVASGFTMAARSSHDLYLQDGCEAFGYYAKIWRTTRECGFQKEYYHPRDGDAVYGNSKRVDCGLTEDDFSESRELGVKFTVTSLVDDTHTNQDGAVEWRLYLDRTGDGEWELVYEFIDYPGSWPTAGGVEVPDECSHSSGDPVYRAGNICFFRSDGDLDTQVRWRQGSIANRFNFCATSRETCNEDLDCCSGQCDIDALDDALQGVCVGESVVPLSTGQWRADYTSRAKARINGRTKANGV